VDISLFERWEWVIKETTEAFCKMFSDERGFDGSFALAVGQGALPDGVDPHDPRVIEIRRECRQRAALTWEAPFTD